MIKNLKYASLKHAYINAKCTLTNLDIEWISSAYKGYESK